MFFFFKEKSERKSSSETCVVSHGMNLNSCIFVCVCDPVLSGYCDRERVMKGVIYGACDFLTKPVRIQELQNIWQHVVRKKIDSKDKNKTASEEIDCSMAAKLANEEEPCIIAGECSQALAPKTNANQNIKGDHKRKAHCKAMEVGEDDKENNEPSNQKKSRLVWDAELHNKFLAAVNQLGIDSECDKDILLI